MALVSRVLEKRAVDGDMEVDVRVTALNLFNPIERAEKKAKARALFTAGLISNNRVVDMERLLEGRDIVETVSSKNITNNGRGFQSGDFTIRVKG